VDPTLPEYAASDESPIRRFPPAIAAHLSPP
jgi:hypothetical protein